MAWLGATLVKVKKIDILTYIKSPNLLKAKMAGTWLLVASKMADISEKLTYHSAAYMKSMGKNQFQGQKILSNVIN